MGQGVLWLARHGLLVLLLFVVRAGAAAAQTAPDPGALDAQALQEAAEAFYGVGLDPARIYPVTRARLQRDRLTVELEGGAIAFAQPVLGRVTGGCYSGRARLSLTPPTAVERAALEARWGSAEFQTEVDALYLRFHDYTFSDLTAAIAPAPDPRRSRSAPSSSERATGWSSSTRKAPSACRSTSRSTSWRRY